MSTSPDKPPTWWDPDARLTALSETTLQLARRLEERILSLPENPPTHEPLDVEDPELAWSAARALRAAIDDASAAGAPRDCVCALHQRLDLELRAITTEVTERVLAERRALLEGVSHDIRSPLNSILFLADALIHEHGGELNASQKRQIGVIYGAAIALVRLVNDLIDLARLDEGVGVTRTTVAFSLDSVLEDVQRLVGPLLSHRQVSLTVHNQASAPRSGDPQLVSRLLINLLTNAIDAAPESGDIEAHFRDEDGARLRLEVTNDGVPPDLDELRRRISGEPGERHMKGRGWTSGLGLTISSRLIRAVRGTMTVDCPGQDRTRFVVELPFPVVTDGS